MRKVERTFLAYVVHEDDLVVARLGVLGVNGDGELMASLDGDLGE